VLVQTVQTCDELDDYLAGNDRALAMVRTVSCTICKSMVPILDDVTRITDATVFTGLVAQVFVARLTQHRRGRVVISTRTQSKLLLEVDMFSCRGTDPRR